MPRGSISRTLTFTACPSDTTSVGFSTRSFLISETWTSPSLPPMKFTNAPKSTMLTTLPSYTLPTSASSTRPLIHLIAASICAGSDDDTLITPSSSMSTLAPVVATISRITLPPVPITSRIFDLSIVKVSIRGACADSSSRVSPSAFAISPRMCARPSFACASATFMISSVIPAILMSI